VASVGQEGEGARPDFLHCLILSVDDPRTLWTKGAEMRWLVALAVVLLSVGACGFDDEPVGVVVTDPEGDICTVATPPDGAGFDCPGGERFSEGASPEPW
jgi:hypothetical protein